MIETEAHTMVREALAMVKASSISRSVLVSFCAAALPIAGEDVRLSRVIVAVADLIGTGAIKVDDNNIISRRQFSATELHIIEIVATMPGISAIGREKLVATCAEALPAPEVGARDNRMVRISSALTDLCKGKDAPFRQIGSVIHFLVG